MPESCRKIAVIFFWIIWTQKMFYRTLVQQDIIDITCNILWTVALRAPLPAFGRLFTTNNIMYFSGNFELFWFSGSLLKKNRWITPLLIFTKTKHFPQTRFFEKLPENCRNFLLDHMNTKNVLYNACITRHKLYNL